MLRGFGVWCHGWGRALELQGLCCLVNITGTGMKGNRVGREGSSVLREGGSVA